jgi:small subunit ribosomal protein S16
MVVIRLQRRGTKKTPHHRIVATDKASPQGGRVLETLGFYDPSYEPPKFSVDETRVGFWVSSGAQMSDAVAKLLKKFKKVSVSAKA